MSLRSSLCQTMENFGRGSVLMQEDENFGHIGSRTSISRIGGRRVNRYTKWQFEQICL